MRCWYSMDRCSAIMWTGHYLAGQLQLRVENLRNDLASDVAATEAVHLPRLLVHVEYNRQHCLKHWTDLAFSHDVVLRLRQVLGGIQLEKDMIMILIMIIILFARRYRLYCNVHKITRNRQRFKLCLCNLLTSSLQPEATSCVQGRY